MIANSHFIRNYDSLALNSQRKIVLDLIESAFESIEPMSVMENSFNLQDNILSIKDTTLDFSKFERIFLIGFGKGSGSICKIIEDKLGNKLTLGYDIDVVDKEYNSVKYTKGTHPLPSHTNIDYTKTVLDNIKNLNEKDLVLVVVCGGGSVLFELPYIINLETLGNVNKTLLRSGATISEMNVIRKHLSRVKGGGLAKHLYPATVATLIFSDVPGNDLSVIASAPTVKDPTTLEDVKKILKRYKILEQVRLTDADFTETPTDDKYFKNVYNIIVLSNLTALEAMQQKAKELGLQAAVYSDRLQGDAKTIGHQLLNIAQSNTLTFIGGETTVHVRGTGKGGRNQALVLATLPFLDQRTVIASFDSDGWDFYELAGAIGDKETIAKAKTLYLDVKQFLDNDDSYTFFEKVGDGIRTGRLESNVSDLIILYKY